VNSHPHLSNSGDLVIIHNGIIENYAPLKVELIKRVMFFIPIQILRYLLILSKKYKKRIKLGKAVQMLNQVVGAYAIAVF
jgi:glucosamine--fructose-6-phosphate aminotransferase (isomerizing)